MCRIKSLGELAGEARSRGVPEVGPQELSGETVVGPGTLVIDVREPGERSKGYIPGSVGIPRGVLERDVVRVAFDGRVGADEVGRRIVCYCGGGSRSLLAAESLRAMGFEGAVSLSGGWRGWCEAGGEVAVDD